MQLTVIFVVLSLAVGYFSGHMSRRGEVELLQNRIDRAFRHWDSHVGGTSLWNGEMVNYNLRTFDSGKNWYQVEYDEDWGMRIVGEAEEVYPGLLKTINGIDELMKHGPITLTSADSPEADLLRNAGFEVTGSQ